VISSSRCGLQEVLVIFTLPDRTGLVVLVDEHAFCNPDAKFVDSIESLSVRSETLENWRVDLCVGIHWNAIDVEWMPTESRVRIGGSYNDRVLAHLRLRTFGRDSLWVH
jgi:hypothetical protein